MTGRTVRTYENDRDLLTSVENKLYNPTTVSKYTYANDDLGRREWVYRDGTAFAERRGTLDLHAARQLHGAR